MITLVMPNNNNNNNIDEDKQRFSRQKMTQGQPREGVRISISFEYCVDAKNSGIRRIYKKSKERQIRTARNRNN